MTSAKKTLPLWPVLLIGLVISPQLLAAPVGKLMFALRAVEVERAGGAVEAGAKGTALNEGDTIRTGDAGRAQILFVDGARVALKPDTVFVIEAYQAPAKVADDNLVASADSGKAVLGMLQGGMRAISGSITKQNPDAMAVRTPVATMGIRGTVFKAALSKDICISIDVSNERELSPKTTCLAVAVTEGQVRVSNEEGSVDVNPGEFGVVGTGIAPKLSATQPAGLVGGDEDSEEAEEEEEESKGEGGEQEDSGEESSEEENSEEEGSEEGSSDDESSSEEGSQDEADEQSASDEQSDEQGSGAGDDDSGEQTGSSEEQGGEQSSSEGGEQQGSNESGSSESAGGEQANSSGGTESSADGSASGSSSTGSGDSSAGDSTSAGSTSGGSTGSSSPAGSTSAGPSPAATSTSSAPPPPPPTQAPAPENPPTTEGGTNLENPESVSQEVGAVRHFSASYSEPGGTYISNGQSVASATDIDAQGHARKFASKSVSAGPQNGTAVNYSIVGSAGNTAAVPQKGADPVTGFNWGRWATGSFDATPNANGQNQTVLLQGQQSLHWLYSPEVSGRPLSEITASASYRLIGSTSPTDVNGQVGVLGAADLSANFSTRELSLFLQLGINDQNWLANGSASMDDSALLPFAGTLTGTYSSPDPLAAGGGVSGQFAGAFSPNVVQLPQGPVSAGAGFSYGMTASDGNAVTGIAIVGNPQ